MLFEICELKSAFEATLAREGILYITDDEGYQRSGYYHFWINKIMCIIDMWNNCSSPLNSINCAKKAGPNAKK